MTSMKLICVVLGSLLSLSLFAQERLRNVFDRNVWLSSENAAALTSFNDTLLSQASLSWKHDAGNWCDFSESNDQHVVAADVSSFKRLFSSVMVYGGIGYTNFNGRNMQGSMLIDDGDVKPFDIVDYSLDNAGRKHKEIIRVNGALGWQMSTHLSLGAKIDYRSGTFVKYKDLRHTNTYMRLHTSAGLFVSSLFNRHISLGATATYRRRIESIEFKTYGTNDKEYFSLVDYAVLTGVVEYFSGVGFTESGSKLPLYSCHLGGGVQASLHFGNGFEWYNSYQYLNQEGSYGEKSQYDISYAQWNGEDMHYESRLSRRSGQSFHILDFSLHSVSLSVKRNICRQERDENNSSVLFYRYYTPVKINDKQLDDLHFAYVWCYEPILDMYRWRVKGGVDVSKIDQTAYLYPSFRRQNITVYKPFVSTEHLFELSSDRYLNVLCEVALQKGSGGAYTDGKLSSVEADSYAISGQMSYLRQNYDYLVKLCVRSCIGVSYHFMSRGMSPFVSLYYNHSHAENDNCLYGSSRNGVNVSLGCDF